ncbi:branched-chain amino acid ABC transporter permease [Synergistales bacterium]|nr:branched-chain amino acid ABC transporter permease [Synergistales bacterium]
MGMGQNIIFGVMRIINFCQGELLMCGMYLSYVFFIELGLDPYLSVPLVSICMFVIGGMIQHFLITPSMGTKSFTNLLFLTVGLGILFQNIAMYFFSANYRSVQTSYSTINLGILGTRMGLPKVVSFVVLIVLTIVLFHFLKATRIGKQIRATAQNPIGAQVVGINIKFIYVITYGLGAMIAGIAGCLLLPFYYVFPQVGATFGLRALIVVIVGGLGNIRGAFFAGIFLGVLETLSSLIVGPSYKDLAVFMTFIVILVVRQKIKLREV